MASWKSTCTYVDEVPPPGANIVHGMWIFGVKRPPGSPPAFKARYVARGFSQRQGVDFFQAFSPTPKMTNLRVLLHVRAQRDYKLHSLDFSTTFLQGSLHEEIWLRRPPGFTGSFPAGTQWSLRRSVYGLHQVPREWHDTLRTTLVALGFAPSSTDTLLFLRTDTTLPPLYVLVYVDNLVFTTADTEALALVKAELSNLYDIVCLGCSRVVHIGGGGSGSGGGGGGGGGARRGGAAQRGGFGGSQRQQQPRSRETPSAQQLREWYAGRGRSGGVGPCTYVLCTGGRCGETCGLPHTAQRCFGRLTDAWRAQFCDAIELPRWGDLLRQNVAIFDLDFDAILAAMYAVADSAGGDCYLCVPPDLGGIEAAALGASASAAPGTGEFAALGTSESAALGAGESALCGTAPIAALHTFTLDSGASRSFFRDSTTLTPLSRPVAVSLADPSGGPVLAHSSTVLPGADLQDLWVDQFTPGGQRVTHCTCSRAGRHLAMFTCRPGSSLYTLSTASPPVPASGQTLLWHHRLGHPSLPHLRGMASRTLVSGLPRSLPPLPPGPAPTCVPCAEGWQRSAPHSSEFPPTEAPLQTLHMDVWGPARVNGQGHERYFLLVVDDYLRYTTVFPLRRKGEVTEVLIVWISGAH
ncbi:unnamed protein product [Closterium sp. NIES-54]